MDEAANAAANAALGTTYVINCASGEYCKHSEGLEIKKPGHHCTKCKKPIHGHLCGHQDVEMGPITCFSCVPPDGVDSPTSKEDETSKEDDERAVADQRKTKRKPPKGALRRGVGALISPLVNKLHPAELVTSVIKNQQNGERLTGCRVVTRKLIKVKGKEQMCIVMTHEKFGDKQIHCSEYYAKCTAEGPSDKFFVVDAAKRGRKSVKKAPPKPVTDNAIDDFEVEGIPLGSKEVDESVYAGKDNREDIERIRQLGFDVDDDKDPNPDNIPDHAKTKTKTTPKRGPGITNLYDDQNWSKPLDCERMRKYDTNDPPKLRGKYSSDDLKHVDLITGYFLFFPYLFFQNVVVSQTSKKLVESNHRSLTVKEFVVFLGLIFYMATLDGYSMREFWDKSNPSMEKGAPWRFTGYMGEHRFNCIKKHITLTDVSPPTAFVDKFWEVRQMIKEWNQNMRDHYVPSWANCLDESMSIWWQRWTCPGWMFVPRKPHPFGNEYHTIADALTMIIWGIELVEGKDEPKEVVRKYDKECKKLKSKTLPLMMRIMEPIFNTGKVVVLDSGFCVLKAIAALRVKGVFAQALIKKRRYWPAKVPGDLIDYYLDPHEIGDTECIQGYIEDPCNIDTSSRVPYNIFCMKDADYTMKIMSTFGKLDILTEGRKKTARTITNKGSTNEIVEFEYTQPFAYHFDFRHCVDDNNHLRHSRPSLEETWTTHRWVLRVFAFLLALSEVNYFLALRFWVWPATGEKKLTLHQFRKKLALSFIHNNLETPTTTYKISVPTPSPENKNTPPSSGSGTKRYYTRRRQPISKKHELLTAPKDATCWLGPPHNKWSMNKKNYYGQFACSKQTTEQCRDKKSRKCNRTYCACNPGAWICKNCHIDHVVDVARDEFMTDYDENAQKIINF